MKKIIDTAFLIILILCFIAILKILVVNDPIFPKSLFINNKKDTVQNVSEEYLNYKKQDQRLLCMTRTLMITYNLSRYEAHYYSIFFDDFSKSYNIPWEIYPAVIKIESNFKPNLTSPKAAKGMMQLLESTAQGVAKELNINYVDGQTIWNDFINVILGCTYLSNAIKDKGLEGGVCVYLGGPDYLRNKDTDDTYLPRYKSTVLKEFKQLSYIFRGVVNEQGLDYFQIHRTPYSDTETIKTFSMFKEISPDSCLIDTGEIIKKLKKSSKKKQIISVKDSSRDSSTL